jgi:hypothetical protein
MVPALMIVVGLAVSVGAVLSMPLMVERSWAWSDDPTPIQDGGALTPVVAVDPSMVDAGDG